MASNDPPGNNSPSLPRGLIGRRGAPAAKGGRLPSMRTPRDLTLGGYQKKTFTPNIPARRAKPAEGAAGESSNNATNTQKTPRGRGPRGRGERGRGRGRREPDVIQSHSIFEQGPSEKLNINKSSASYSYGGGGDGGGGGGGGGGVGGGSGCVFNAKVKCERPQSEETKRIIDDLLRDDFVADKDGRNDNNMGPVQLPLAHIVKKEDIKEEKIKVKAEPGSEESAMEIEVPSIEDSIPTVRPNTPEDISKMTCQDLFMRPQNQHGDLIFLQLPDSLPGAPLTKPDERPKKPTDKAPNSQPEKDISEDMKKCTLNDISEGYIGKLQVLKSGKTRLLLGNVNLDVSMGTPCGFLQDLVSVQIAGETGDMCSLGNIKHRLVCLPDFESLLTQTQR